MIYPGCDTKMLAGYNTRLARCDGLILHIAVSNAYWPSYLTGTAAHWYGRKNGSVGQQVDSRMRGGSNLEGNAFFHAMETEGGVGADAGAPWTEAQLYGMARIAQMSSQEWGWPLRLMSSSNDRGLGWHRLGIDGNFPSGSLLSGRLQRGGGRRFSKAYGKICPTDPRIRQIPTILELARSTQVNLTHPTPPGGLRALYLAEPYMYGEDVADWQRILNRLGFSTDVDGWFGPGTDRATIAFQRSAGLRQDGDVGPVTRAAALDRLAPAPLVPKDWFDMATEGALREIVDSLLNARVPRMLAYKIPGTHAAYRDVRGRYRVHIPGSQGAQFQIVELPVTDPFWTLPITSNSVPGELYKLDAGLDPTGTAYAIEPDGLRHIPAQEWQEIQRVNPDARITVLPPDHPVWTLPRVSTPHS